MGQRHVGGVDEGLDVYGLRRLDIGAAQVLVGQHDIRVVLVFITLDDVVPRDVLAGVLVIALETDGREVAPV